MENIVFYIDGGIGKVIMGSVVIRNIKKKYPDKNIVVLSGYPWIFDTNPNVYRSMLYGYETKYIFDDYIKNGKGIAFKNEPYLDDEYILGKKHLTQAWCELFSLPFDNPKPDLFLTDAEIEVTGEWAEDARKKNKKDIMLIQTKGGAVPQQPNQPVPKMYVRDLPKKVAQTIVDEYKDDYLILNVGGQWRELKGAQPVIAESLREIMCLIMFADKMLFIDSFMQHATGALGKQAVVVWGGTSPVCLGYENNINLVPLKPCPEPFCHRPNSYIFDKRICPYGEICMRYEAKYIIEEINKNRKDNKEIQ